MKSREAEATERLASLLRDSGAAACGMVEAQSVEETEWRRFEQWIAAGRHAGMRYMERYPEIRRDPRLLLEGTRSIVSVAFSYRQPNPLEGRVATYALGEDYHKVLRRRLKAVVREMAVEIGGDWRICIDSAPMLERYWARKAGVGRRSPVHGNIIVSGVGSMVFLAELLTTLRLETKAFNFVSAKSETIDGKEEKEGRQCCPTGALLPGGTVDSARCINYLTIEERGELTPGQERLIGSAFFGCDICQRACPENQGLYAPILPEFRPMEGIAGFVDGLEDSGFDLARSAMSRRFRERREAE